MKYAAIDSTTGIVIQTIEASDLETLALNTPEGAHAHPVRGEMVEPGLWKWDGEKLVALPPPVLTPAQLEASLIGSLKETAEGLKMQFATPGEMKKAEYAGKAAEVASWDAAIGASAVGTAAALLAVINEWSPERRAATFPYALADAKAFGDTIDKAIARFRAGMKGAGSVHAVAAVEAVGTAAIKKAATLQGKQAAFDAVKWPG